MKQPLHQPTKPPPSSAPLFFRSARGPGPIAFLLVLLAAGLGLLALMSTGWHARKEVTGVSDSTTHPLRVAQSLPSYQDTSPAKTLQDILAHPDYIPTHHDSHLGLLAPDFELADTQGKAWNLKQLIDGRPAVLIFYHGYHCVSCVRQLFDVNRDLALFGEAKARVVAISADPSELTRRGFEQNGPFGFPVLSDPEHKVAQIYGVFQPAHDGMTADILRHGTFIIDRDGIVQWVNVGDAPFRRNSAVLCQLAKMEPAP